MVLTHVHENRQGCPGHYRELILAGTFAAMATWEVLEMALLEPAPRASISLALVVHSLQIALILTATAIALRAWREKTARERALASLVEQVIVAQEEERRRVAYDVHDGVAQLIVSAKQHIDTAADLWTTDPGRAASETVIAADRLGRAITETRRILAALRPLAVDAAGLAEAARQSLDEVARDTGWSVALVENLGEANLLRANTHSFTATTSAGGTVQLSHETTALTINNLLNNEYATFGTFAPNGKVESAPVVRFLTLAPPINVLAGASYRF